MNDDEFQDWCDKMILDADGVPVRETVNYFPTVSPIYDELMEFLNRKQQHVIVEML